MKRFLTTFVIGGLFGFVAGAGAMLVLFPYLFPPAAVNETVAGLTSMGKPQALQESRFREGTSGQDIGHWGKGSLRLYGMSKGDGDYLLELQEDFEVGPGPNFWIYLNTKPNIDDEADFNADTGRHRLAKLKSFTGSQVYRVPMDQMPAAGAVTIWCETFGQYIASANVGPQTN